MLISFRYRHEQLKSIVDQYESRLNHLSKELEIAYNGFRQSDIFDIKLEQELSSLLYSYDQQVNAIDQILLEDLKEKLNKCRSPMDTLSVLESHKILLSRPKIRSALMEFQGQLINLAKSELIALQETALSSKDNVVPEGTSGVAAEIHRLKRLDSQLQRWIQCLNNVLEPGWDLSQGHQLTTHMANLRKSLDTKPVSFSNMFARYFRFSFVNCFHFLFFFFLLLYFERFSICG